MPRAHGYAPKGHRCIGSHDWHAKGRVNVIGALLAGVLLSVGLTDVNIDAEIFNLWLIRDLLPKLPPDPVLVWIVLRFTDAPIQRPLSPLKGIRSNISPPTAQN